MEQLPDLRKILGQIHENVIQREDADQFPLRIHDREPAKTSRTHPLQSVLDKCSFLDFLGMGRHHRFDGGRVRIHSFGNDTGYEIPVGHDAYRLQVVIHDDQTSHGALPHAFGNPNDRFASFRNIHFVLANTFNEHARLLFKVFGHGVFGQRNG